MLNKSFDWIFDSKVGHGTYQRISYLFVGLVALSDEAEIITLSIILPTITKQWELSQGQQQALGSALFLGILLGSVLIGFVADKIGRKYSLVASSGLQFVLGALSSTVQSFEMLMFFRSALGFMIGCSIPVAVTYITEISTSAYRGRSQVFIQIFFVIGMLYATLMSLIFMQNLENGDWRSMLLVGALPSLLVFLGTLFYLEESPRFLLSIGKFEEAYSKIEKIGSKNSGRSHAQLTLEEKEDLQFWQENTFEKRDKASIKALFHKENLRLTIPLLFSWFGLSFNFFGMVFILPFILNNADNATGSGTSEIMNFFLVLFGEIPALAVAFFIVDHRWFGRKNSTLLGHFLGAVAFFIAYFTNGNTLIGFLILARLATKLSFITINPLTTELYPTNYRALALGFTSGVGRLGAVLMPSVSLELYNVDKLSPVLAFSLVAVIMIITLYFVPFEPYGRSLDHTLKGDEETYALKDKEEEGSLLLLS